MSGAGLGQSLPHLTGPPGWQTGQTDSLLQVGLAVELEEGNVIVQSLAVVVVVDVGGGHPQSLGPGRAVPLGQVVISHSHVDRVTSSDDAKQRSFYLSLDGDW